MSQYQVYELDVHNRVFCPPQFVYAATDEAAIEEASKRFCDRGMEIWHEGRFVFVLNRFVYGSELWN